MLAGEPQDSPGEDYQLHFILLSVALFYLCSMNGGGHDSGSVGNHVIFPMEAEAYIQELTTFGISDIGSNK